MIWVLETRIFESDQSELQSVVPTLYVGKICGNCILNAKICIEYAEIAKKCFHNGRSLTDRSSLLKTPKTRETKT